jgi:hypothetical protein
MSMRCANHVGLMRRNTQFWSQNRKGEYHFRGLDVDEKIILKLVLRDVTKDTSMG